MNRLKINVYVGEQLCLTGLRSLDNYYLLPKRSFVWSKGAMIYELNPYICVMKI